MEWTNEGIALSPLLYNSDSQATEINCTGISSSGHPCTLIPDLGLAAYYLWIKADMSCNSLIVNHGLPDCHNMAFIKTTLVMCFSFVGQTDKDIFAQRSHPEIMCDTYMLRTNLNLTERFAKSVQHSA